MFRWKSADISADVSALTIARNCRLRPKRQRLILGPMYEMEKYQAGFGYQYELETKRIRVAVRPAYLDDQSSPEDDRYVWSYTVTIENRGAEPVQLLSRYWNIVDGAGRVQEVRGAGVVGAQPVIAPGESFQYTSGCPLETASGTMSGRYQMMSASGESFEAEIPAFLLESPYERRQIH